MNRHLVRILGAALLAGVVATTAFAGGSNYTYDPDHKVPYAWNPQNWVGGAVPVYTDLGNLKNSNPLITNERADELVVAGWAQWNAVPTSTMRAQVLGDFSSIGLPEINRTNAGLIFGQWNGGGIHVIYDTDGGIFKDWFGATGVLGVAQLELVAPEGPEILEAWVVINGSTVSRFDPNAVAYGGVFTHEFGHSVNLAHSQANGATIKHQDPPQPRDCSAPWTGMPSLDQVETMYPFLGVSAPNDSGAGMATVDRLDDIAAISDIYPAPGWPDGHGTIHGTVTSLLTINGAGTGEIVQVTGANVIARNVADPFNDFTSKITGLESKGAVGPDGSFELHGLTPGAQYVVYLDNLQTGAYSSVPRLLTLPGPEEYYNGTSESGNGREDDRCAWTTVTATPGSPVTADMTFNRVKGAPEMTWLSGGLLGADMTPDGRTIVGTVGNGYFIYDTTTGGIEYPVGGFPQISGAMGVSDDGTRMVGNYLDPETKQIGWGIYENGAWTKIPHRADAATPCGYTGTGGTWGSPSGISGDGRTVFGGMYGGGCRYYRATKWTAEEGVVVLPKYDEDTSGSASRATAANYDGSIIIGRDSYRGLSRGAYWVNGVEHLFSTHPDPTVDFVGEALDITGDGSTIVGQQAGIEGTANTKKAAWRFFTATDELEMLSDNTTDRRGVAFRIDGTGSVIAGWNDKPDGRLATIWTNSLKWTPFKQFLNVQGTFYEGTEIVNASSISADGHRILGYSVTNYGNMSWIMDIPKAVLCHRPPNAPRTQTHTIDVTFPGGLDEHLAHGDTLGVCQHGGE